MCMILGMDDDSSQVQIPSMEQDNDALIRGPVKRAMTIQQIQSMPPSHLTPSGMNGGMSGGNDNLNCGGTYLFPSGIFLIPVECF